MCRCNDLAAAVTISSYLEIKKWSEKGNSRLFKMPLISSWFLAYKITTIKSCYLWFMTFIDLYTGWVLDSLAFDELKMILAISHTNVLVFKSLERYMDIATWISRLILYLNLFYNICKDAIVLNYNIWINVIYWLLDAMIPN